MYRPGKSGGDSESTPDTKPVVWAITGRRGGTCGKSEKKKQKSKRKEPVAMNNVKNLTVKAPQEPCRFTKRLGSTTYHVVVHFNPDTKETANEKIARLMSNEAAMGKAVNQ